ncbi:MAG: xanthine dehydrogenase family protein molybdopterin-binding subunit [Rhodospirillales bacterium]
MGMKFIGARVPRLEDPALLTGRGQYVDDLHLHGMVHAAMLRSPHAHARIRKIDTSKAMAMPGVHLVMTYADLPPPAQKNRLPMLVPNPAIKQPLMPYALAKDEVCFAGDGVAIVVADSRYLAEDAAALIEVEYDVLPAAGDCREALKPGAPVAHAGAKDNLAGQFTLSYGDVEGAFARAAKVVSANLWHHRGGGHAMECRAVIAQWDPIQAQMTLWSATQSPFLIRRSLTELLGWDEDDLRVVATPDVGGGFGPKTIFHPEEVLVPLCARRLGRPVKWVEDRRENFVATTQERDQYWDVELAVDGDGRLLGLRGGMIHDTGAFMPWGIISPYISTMTTPGPYVLPAFRLETRVALTNKVGTTPVRGAGRPQAVFAMERLLDKAADALGIERAELRRRNLIQPDQMPYNVGIISRDGKPVVYDSGDYPGCQEKAEAIADYAGFRDRQKAARAEGRYLGIGIANYVEATGLGPFEGATVRIGPSGRIFLNTGASPQGQGHRTALAQICAEKFGVGLEDVQVGLADTGIIASGVGTFASRIAVNAGSSVHLAAMDVKKKVIKVASHLLEAAEEDIEVEGGKVFVRGVPNMSRTLGEIAKSVAGMPGFALPGGVEPGLEATQYFSPAQAAYCNGTAIAEVEVDIETGRVDIVRYAMGHDSGNLINPMIVDGQVFGAVAHGIGNALYEWMVYDGDANPVSTNFAEYLLPSAPEVPRVDVVHQETPSPLNPLGVKGAGEGGTIPAAAAIMAAIEDALSAFNVKIEDTPITPSKIVQLIHKGQSNAA